MVQEAAVLVVKRLIVYNSEPKSKSRIHVHYAPWDYVACFGAPRRQIGASLRLW